MYSFGLATYDEDTRRLTGPAGSKKLWRQTHALFMPLVEKRDKIVRISALILALWPDPDDQPDYSLISLRVRICNLRKDLNAVGADVRILSTWGVGYTLVTQRGNVW